MEEIDSAPIAAVGNDPVAEPALPTGTLPGAGVLLPDRPAALARTAQPKPRSARQRRRARLHQLRHALLAAIIMAAAVLTVFALRPRPLPVDVARATRGPLHVVIEETGVTRVTDRYLVSAPVSGELSRVTLEPGDEVKEGDALIEIAPATSALLDARAREAAEARVSAAVQALGQARAQQERAVTARQLSTQQLARDQTLVGSGSLSQQALEQSAFLNRMRAQEVASAEFASKVAMEELRVARAALGQGGPAAARHVAVMAPVSGSVLRVIHESAQIVQAGTEVLELGDPRALEVVVDLLTTDAVHIHAGTPVTLQGWGGDRSLQGRVRRIEPSAFTRLSALGIEEQRVNAIVSFTEPQAAWAALGDGYRIEARLILWQGDDVIRAPQGAVFRRGNGWAAFRVEGDEAKLTAVQVGHRGETELEITAGLSAGDELIVHPGDRIKDGVAVEPR